MAGVLGWFATTCTLPSGSGSQSIDRPGKTCKKSGLACLLQIASKLRALLIAGNSLKVFLAILCSVNRFLGVLVSPDHRRPKQNDRCDIGASNTAFFAILTFKILRFRIRIFEMDAG